MASSRARPAETALDRIVRAGLQSRAGEVPRDRLAAVRELARLRRIERAWNAAYEH